MPKGKSFLHSCVTPAIIAIAGITSSAAIAGPTVELNTFMIGDWDDVQGTYGYAANGIVNTSESVGGSLVMAGHDALSLDDASPLGRLGYLLTAGQLNARAQWATSTLFGHEYAHFQAAHRFGRTEHYFPDNEGGRLSTAEAYWNVFSTGEVGSPATSTGVGSAPSGIATSNAGLNWQMNYSESWLRDQMLNNDKTVFDTSNFFLNRIYFSAYFAGAANEAFGSSTSNSDPSKFARHMERKHGEENALDRATKYAIVANLVSPSFWQVGRSWNAYVLESDRDAPAFEMSFAAGSITWDVPHYLSDDSMTLAPIVYWTPSAEMREFAQADDLTIGVGFESAVMGSASQEARLTIDARWDNITLASTTALGADGAFQEIEAGYAVTENTSFTAGLAKASGDTLRASRNLPGQDAAAWAGVKWTF